MLPDPIPPRATFAPRVFEVETLEEAKAIIVTPEAGTTTEERWVRETDYLVNDICERLAINETHCVLDFGCGIGRVAKVLIERTACRVIGVDSSISMRLFAPNYVVSDRFCVWEPDVFQAMVKDGYRFDFGLCIWVIQHVLDPAETIQHIGNALAADGRLYTVNNLVRCVPTDKGWVSDGFDVQAALRNELTEDSSHRLPLAASNQAISELSLIQILRKSGDTSRRSDETHSLNPALNLKMPTATALDHALGAEVDPPRCAGIESR